MQTKLKKDRDTGVCRGLTDKQAEESAKLHGKNGITAVNVRTFWQTYWENYDDPIIIVLLVALGINVMFTFTGKVDWQECLGILISVIISTFVSALSEHSNETTFRKLQEEASRTECKVYRNGILTVIPIDEIVCGDCTVLQAGDIIPADGRIVSGSIRVDQSPLNGESAEVIKENYGAEPKKTVFNDFWNGYSVFRGSVVTGGEAVMVTDRVGDSTVYGRLTRETQNKTVESPLSVKLSKLAKSISKFGCVSAVFIVIISFLNNAVFSQHFDSVMIAGYFADKSQVISDIVSSVIIGITVIVVAVPEGLPLMIAIVCSLNMRKLLKANVLVRRLIGIETSGGINILFTDKTGTITCGKPKVAYVTDGSGREYCDYEKLPRPLAEWMRISAVANSAAEFSKGRIIGGNPSEKAILEFVGEKAAVKCSCEIISKTPFTSENKYSAVQINDGKTVTLIKGAPEIILDKCGSCYNQTGEKKKISPYLNEKLQKAAERSMRLIAVAVYDGAWDGGKLPDNMTLISVAAIRDDVRAEAADVVAQLKGAGIQVVMITGDRSETAEAIAREAGMLEKDSVTLTSKQLAEMTDNEVIKLLPRLRVVSRAVPEDKSRLVRLAQRMNMVVGMTGDGVNDAPALKAADVGFAMGGGTEAAAAVSDIVILDDNLKSIKSAVLYGRTIYKSIKKFIRFQLTINVAAVAVSVLGPIVGIEKPLSISQMIWTNLMIDSLAAIAFGGEPALKRYMRMPPGKRDESIIDGEMWLAVITNALYICALSLVFFISPRIHSCFRYAADDIYFYTGYFTFFIFISVFNGFNARCDGIDLFENLSRNKQFTAVMTGIIAGQILMTYFGGSMLRTAGLNFKEWSLVLPAALTVIPMEVIRKLINGKSFKGEKDR